MENARGEKSVFDLFKRKKALAVEFIELPTSMILSEVDCPERFEELEQDHILLETPNELFAIDQKGEVAYRYTKPKAQPRIIKVRNLELSPDSFSIKAELSQPGLFEFAKRQCLYLFETDDGFYIPSDSVVFYAKKERGENNHAD